MIDSKCLFNSHFDRSVARSLYGSIARSTDLLIASSLGFAAPRSISGGGPGGRPRGPGGRSGGGLPSAPNIEDLSPVPRLPNFSGHVLNRTYILRLIFIPIRREGRRISVRVRPLFQNFLSHVNLPSFHKFPTPYAECPSEEIHHRNLINISQIIL